MDWIIKCFTTPSIDMTVLMSLTTYAICLPIFLVLYFGVIKVIVNGMFK